ncbi:MAG: hypothetical protein BM556_05420 [Bacteriovorax sp. MedPE-SWde]|nr:MAG: hypothetical protein BM556_05420 [Bacteriovorax sp. MedPE-SWde]
MLENYKVLVCEDDPKIQVLADQILTKIGKFNTTIVNNGEQLLTTYNDTYDVVILDIRLPDISGVELLKKIIARNSKAIVIMMTAFSTENLVIECLRSGAYNYIKKPFDINYLISSVKEACELSQQMRDSNLSTVTASTIETFKKSSIILEIEDKINKLADKKLSILLTGESGTGKEYFAKLIAERRGHLGDKYIDVNCPAIPETLFESELFGHVKGAFTGATEDKPGKFTLAHNGTLFLDEIADLDSTAQSKLLRVLQEREVIPVGATKNIPVEFQLISATSKDLKVLMTNDVFRPDLYYRICDIEIVIPSLREHLEDIPELVSNIIDEYCKENNIKPRSFSEDAIDCLKSYNWPGNIRELKSAIRRILILHDEEIISSETILEDLKKHFISVEVSEPNIVRDDLRSNGAIDTSEKSLDIKDAEKDLIIAALDRCNYNLSSTAKELGFGRSTLYRKIKKYNIKT